MEIHFLLIFCVNSIRLPVFSWAVLAWFLTQVIEIFMFKVVMVIDLFQRDSVLLILRLSTDFRCRVHHIHCPVILPLSTSGWKGSIGVQMSQYALHGTKTFHSTEVVFEFFHFSIDRFGWPTTSENMTYGHFLLGRDVTDVARVLRKHYAFTRSFWTSPITGTLRRLMIQSKGDHEWDVLCINSSVQSCPISRSMCELCTLTCEKGRLFLISCARASV